MVPSSQMPACLHRIMLGWQKQTLKQEFAESHFTAGLVAKQQGKELMFACGQATKKSLQKLVLSSIKHKLWSGEGGSI